MTGNQAVTNVMSDITMSVIGVTIVGAASYLWLTDGDVPDPLGILVGVVVSYFYSRNHTSALNAALRDQTAGDIASRLSAAAQAVAREQNAPPR